MKEENKPDNLEQFFQRVLRGHEEDPGAAFWDRIAPNIPPKPKGKSPFVYKGWMIILAFLSGLIVSTCLLNWQSNTLTIDRLGKELLLKETQIVEMEQTITQLQNTLVINENLNEKEVSSLKEASEITQRLLTSKAENLKELKKLVQNLSAEKERLIKLEIARETSVVAAAEKNVSSELQPFYVDGKVGSLFDTPSQMTANYKLSHLLFDNQLISNSFFAGNNGIYQQEKELVPAPTNNFDHLPMKEKLAIDYPLNMFDLTEADKRTLLPNSVEMMSFGLGEDALTSYITATFNPISSYKYNLNGYKPRPSAIAESAGISTSWNWSVYGGFETKSKWSVQVGLDFNKLIIVKESLNNIRFNTNEATRVNGGFLYSFNQRSDGALGQVVVNTNILNQLKNDGKDVLNGDLFSLSVRTKQPVRIVRLPIMGGYRIDLSKRFYATPKLGISAVWKIKDQTELESVKTLSERISVQKTNIFLTSTSTTESLEANFRTEFGYRWRPRWYLIAEPRFKYSGKGLFRYKDLELVDTPFHLMFGIRFNVD